jgi:DHA1 family bicyclomycin/chloramphenicol resistance-like MFS transporter/DHA1 family 2-module integral membrane pump EmrD-like MFS transporter
MNMQKKKRIVFINNLVLLTLGVFASDLYVPSLPAIALALQASHSDVKLTIAFYLLGFGLSPLLVGPLSDHYGRRKVLINGLFISIIGSLFCVFAGNVDVLIFGRFVQGAGIASGVCISRSSSNDVFDYKDLARFGSYLGASVAYAPIIAPIIGAYLQLWFGWRSNFVFLLFITTIATLFALKKVPETSNHFQKDATQIKKVLTNYWRLLSNKKFIVYPLCACFASSGIMVYLTLSPFLFQAVIKLTAVEYGWLAVVVGGSMVIGSLINVYLIRHFEIMHILFGSIIVMIFSSAAMLIFGYLGYLNVIVIIIPMFFFFMGVRMILANVFSIGMKKIAPHAGVASALFSTIQIGGSSFSCFYASMLQSQNQIKMSILLLLLSMSCCLLIYYCLIRRSVNA